MKEVSYANQSWTDLIILFVVCIAAFFFYTYNNDFPIYFHSDEPKKFLFVLENTQDFKHPILMLQLGRIANFLLQTTDHASLAILCRSISALGGVAIIIMSYLIGRRHLGKSQLWFVIILVMTSPILVVHAHYYKEDMVFTASALLAIWCYLELLKDRSKRLTIALGVAMGLVLSAQYKSVLLIGLFFLFPLLDRVVISLSEEKAPISGLYPKLLLSLGIGIIIALLINYPALLDPAQMIWGITKEKEHVSFGHTIRIYPLPHYFSFHIMKSLLPGITLPVLTLAAIGLVVSVFSWRRISTNHRFLLIFVIVFYLAHEITPMKPAPGFMRYMIPITPVLILFAGLGFQMICNLLKKSPSSGFSNAIGMLCMLLIFAFPMYKSALLVDNLSQKDTRVAAFDWFKQRQGDGAVYFGKHTLLHNKESGRIYKLDKETIAQLRQAGFRYAIASSFGYDVYYYGAGLEKQIERVYRHKRRFEEIFNTLDYHEIAPNYQSFSFSNPVIRIIDLDSAPPNNE